MQHIGDIVATNVANLSRVNGHRPRPLTLPMLIDRFEEQEANENEDMIVATSNLRFDPDGELLVVPTLGAFRFTDWSRHQLSTLVGIRWERWKEGASSTDLAEELNRRFMRAAFDVKVRTMRTPGSNETGDGVVRAFVSPGYSPVQDSEMAIRLQKALRSTESDLSIVRYDATDRTTSYVVKIGTEYRVGGPGEVGDVWGCVLLRNSGVGYASLVVVAHLHRLACKNGLALPADAHHLTIRARS